MAKTLVILMLAAAAFATRLSDAAASMKAGEWKEFAATGLTDQFLIGCGHTDCILHYANTGCWDPVRKKALFFGSPHAGHNHKLIIYNDAADAWTSKCWTSVPDNFGTHAYDNDAIDVSRGMFWYKPKGNPWTTTNKAFIRYDIAADNWVPGAVTMPGNLPAPNQYSGTGATKFFPERDELVYVCGGSPNLMYRYNVSTQAWSTLSGFSLTDVHIFAQYNTRHKCIVFGGGEQWELIPRRELYKYDASGTITRLKDMPASVTKGVMITGAGNHTCISEEPVTGCFLTLSDDGKFWSYDLAAETWISLPDAPVVSSSYGLATQIAIPISTYGVTMVLWGHWAIAPKIYLYKHATGATENPPKNLSRAEGRLSCVAVYSCDGKKVRSFPENSAAPARWDGRDSFGRAMPAGMYIMDMRNSAGERRPEKMMLLR